MRRLYLGNGDNEFKFADTTTQIHLSALDNAGPANLTSNAKVRIKNDSGYLMDANATVDGSQAIITSGQLGQLPPGSYLLELWDTTSDGGTAIYPSDGFLAIQINENVAGLSGKIISSMTVDDFVKQFSDLSQQLKKQVSDAVSNGLKGDKGDDGTSFKTFTTDYAYSQDEIDKYSTSGYNGTWSVNESTSELRVGDTVQLRLTNTSKAGYCFLIAKVTAIPSDKNITCVSYGLIDKGDKGDNAVINIVTQAQYDALTDKSGVYFIEG